MQTTTIKNSILNPKYRNQERQRILKNRYNPLYGLEIIYLLLKKDNYTLVSLSPNSIPTPGSQTLSIEKITPMQGEEVEKVIVHKNLDVTIKTKNKGFVKFLK